MEMNTSTAENKEKLFTRIPEKSEEKQVEVCRGDKNEAPPKKYLFEHVVKKEDKNEEIHKKYLFEHVVKKEETNGLQTGLEGKAEREK